MRSASVEDVLSIALYRAGFITEMNLMSVSKIGWTRSSRTDKGVHATGVMVCAKLHVDDVSDVISATEPYLPQDLRLFAAFPCRR